ncbi:MAG: hypothetical protein U9R04_03315 [Chloroflexota bacterium]|nr:hypothetical protein [Chloroflexota bacterium]
MQKQGEWKPYNVRFLQRNMALVFRTGDIRKLNKYTYTFIIDHMGFIAHYDLIGFQCTYADLNEFREKLQTSEYSNRLDYNLDWADRYEGDRDFIKWYGSAYCKSVAEGIKHIIAVARNQHKQEALPIPAWELV